MAANCLCLKCGGTFSTPDGRRGSDVPCPKCGAAVRVPPAASPPAARRVVKAKPVAADAERRREPDARHDEEPARFPTAGVVGIAAAVGVGMLAVIVAAYLVADAGRRPDVADVMPGAIEPVAAVLEEPATVNHEAMIGGVRVLLTPDSDIDSDRLMVLVHISTDDRTRKIDYRSWRSTFGIGRDVAATDNFGNKYKQVSANLLDAADMLVRLEESARRRGMAAGAGPVSAGLPRLDFFFLEMPIASAAYLDIELSGRNVGVSGPFRFRIGKADWTPEPAAPVEPQATPAEPQAVPNAPVAPIARAVPVAPVDQLVPLSDDMRAAALEQLRKAVANRGKDADYLKRLKQAKSDLTRAEAGVINRSRKTTFTPPDKTSPINYPTPEAKADAVAKAKAALDKLAAEATGPIADLGKYAPPLTADSSFCDVGRFFSGGGHVVQVLGDREARIRPDKLGTVYVVKGIDAAGMANGYRADVPGVFYVAGRRGGETIIDNIGITTVEYNAVGGAR